jgi:hypothetical protein
MCVSDRCPDPVSEVTSLPGLPQHVLPKGLGGPAGGSLGSGRSDHRMYSRSKGSQVPAIE